MPHLMELFQGISLFAKLSAAVPLAALTLAVLHAARPTEQRLAMMRPLSLASIFATISGLVGGWIAVLSGVAAAPGGNLPSSSLYQGLAESLVLGFVWFGLLAAAWLLVAVAALRRERLRDA